MVSMIDEITIHKVWENIKQICQIIRKMNNRNHKIAMACAVIRWVAEAASEYNSDVLGILETAKMHFSVPKVAAVRLNEIIQQEAEQNE